MIPVIIDPILEGMTIVLSRDAAKKHKTTRKRVGLVTKVKKKYPESAGEAIETFTVEILEPKSGACTCICKKKHRVNQTTGDVVCTDEFGEFRHGFVRVPSPKVIKLAREDFWRIQQFPEGD